MCVYVTGRATTFKNVVPQANIADIDTGTVDDAYGAPEEGVLGDLQTKVQTILDQLQALGLQASS